MSFFSAPLKSIATAAGAVKNGSANAYRRSAMAGKASFGAASIMAGSFSGGMKGLGGRMSQSYAALGGAERRAMLGQAIGMGIGAGMGAASSPEGWGAAGGAAGATAGFFGGARGGQVAGAAARMFGSSGGMSGVSSRFGSQVAGMKQGASNTYSAAKRGFSNFRESRAARAAAAQ